MEFRKLHDDINHECVNQETKEDTESLFARKLGSSSLKEADFLSYWELEKRPKSLTELNICRFKGVSINRYSDGQQLKEHYRILFKRTKSFAPKLPTKKYFCIFKFKDGAGLIWFDGRKPYYHCTFFKCDSFSIDYVDLKQIESF